MAVEEGEGATTEALTGRAKHQLKVRTPYNMARLVQ